MLCDVVGGDCSVGKELFLLMIAHFISCRFYKESRTYSMTLISEIQHRQKLTQYTGEDVYHKVQ